MIKLNDLRDNPGARKKFKRVGRGMGSGKGKTAGSGVKGQKSRTGVALGGFEGGQMPLVRRLPKRGFNNIFAKDYAEVTLVRLQNAIDSGKIDGSQPVTCAVLIESGVCRKAKDGVRLVATGSLTAKVQIAIAGASKGAIAAVEKAGGKIEIVAPRIPAHIQASMEKKAAKAAKAAAAK